MAHGVCGSGRNHLNSRRISLEIALDPRFTLRLSTSEASILENFSASTQLCRPQFHESRTATSAAQSVSVTRIWEASSDALRIRTHHANHASILACRRRWSLRGFRGAAAAQLQRRRATTPIISVPLAASPSAAPAAACETSACQQTRMISTRSRTCICVDACAYSRSSARRS